MMKTKPCPKRRGTTWSSHHQRSINATTTSVVLGLLLLVGTTSAQPDAGVCACAPYSYGFTLDFSSTCDRSDLVPDDGISSVFCEIAPFGGPGTNITDLVPAVVDFIDIIEFDQDFNVVVQFPVSGPLFDGDMFSFESIVSENPSVIPRILQLNVFAFNAQDEPIANFFSVAFTNDCGVYPVFETGYDPGWVVFVSWMNGHLVKRFFV